MIRKQEIKEVKNEANRMLKILDEETSNTLAISKNKRYFRRRFRCRFLEKPHDFEKERELRLSAKEKRNAIKRLKEEVKNKEDKLLNDNSESNNTC